VTFYAGDLDLVA
jgi:hypothetical protein